jgi:hypothetical protein
LVIMRYSGMESRRIKKCHLQIVCRWHLHRRKQYDNIIHKTTKTN